MKLTIGYLYPDLFDLYGDRGNVRCLYKRLQWRGIGAEVVPFLSGSKIDFSAVDILCWGGGSDRSQELAAGYLREIRRDFREYVEADGVVLAVCAAFQLLGEYYKTESGMVEGLGILDIRTRWEPGRLVGNVVLESPLFRAPVVGFENHAGRTCIGNHTPLGKVLFGHGNTGQDGCEGVVYRNVIGTYLHGPLLPKNPEVCDFLLERALKRKYGGNIALEELGDLWENRAKSRILERYGGRPEFGPGEKRKVPEFGPGEKRKVQEFVSGEKHEAQEFVSGKKHGAQGFVSGEKHGTQGFRLGKKRGMREPGPGKKRKNKPGKRNEGRGTEERMKKGLEKRGLNGNNMERR